MKPIQPQYAAWRNRVEGQIRHTIHEHPEWFDLPDEETKNRCIRSMAKRIIGEIVAAMTSGDKLNAGGIVPASIRSDE